MTLTLDAIFTSRGVSRDVDAGRARLRPSRHWLGSHGGSPSRNVSDEPARSMTRFRGSCHGASRGIEGDGEVIDVARLPGGSIKIGAS